MTTTQRRDPIRWLEGFIFWSRWLQAPLYVGLIAAQGVSMWTAGPACPPAPGSGGAGFRPPPLRGAGEGQGKGATARKGVGPRLGLTATPAPSGAGPDGPA